MWLLNFKNVHHRSYAYIAFKHGKDAKTVHNELVEVFGLSSTPNLRSIYFCFEDMWRDRFTLEKSTRPGRPRSARTPSITQNVQKMTYQDPRMSVRDLSYSLSVASTSVYRILTEELSLRNVCSVWIPTVLTEKKINWIELNAANSSCASLEDQLRK